MNNTMKRDAERLSINEIEYLFPKIWYSSKKRRFPRTNSTWKILEDFRNSYEIVPVVGSSDPAIYAFFSDADDGDAHPIDIIFHPLGYGDNVVGGSLQLRLKSMPEPSLLSKYGILDGKASYSKSFGEDMDQNDVRFHWDMRLARRGSYLDKALRYFLKKLIEEGHPPALKAVAEHERRKLAKATKLPLRTAEASTTTQRGRL